MTPQRAATNRLFHAFDLQDFEGTVALEKLLRSYEKRSRSRESIGDGLREAVAQRSRRSSKVPSHVQPCFSSVLQRDHAGIEFATESHTALLESAGILSPRSLSKGGCPVEDVPVQKGVPIDDFFVIAKVPAKEIPRLTASSFTPASDCLRRAKQVYSAEGILGSDEKDVVNSSCAKVAGAEVDSSPRALDLGEEAFLGLHRLILGILWP